MKLIGIGNALQSMMLLLDIFSCASGTMIRSPRSRLKRDILQPSKIA